MATTSEIFILGKCFQYAYDNSVAFDDSTAKVVVFNDFKNDTAYRYSQQYNYVLSRHEDFLDYLKHTGRDIVRSGVLSSWWDWNFEIMDLYTYENDKRHDHGYFSRLRYLPYVNGDDYLIVVYLKEDKRQYEAERAQINRQMAQEYYDPPSPPAPPPKPKLDLSGEVNALYDVSSKTKSAI